ncbi:MAG: hypothetical protein HYX69_00135 [Planctomycetia bacterium]|nr:hypothetical protein [Planctomycetia bacterium]
MSIWSKVLVALVFVALLPFFYLSSRLLRTNEAWRGEVEKWRRAVFAANEGPPPRLNLDQLALAERDARAALHEAVVDRGRVWTPANPEKAFDASSGEGTVKIDVPSPHRILPKMVLFAFDSDGYLGEFQAMAATDTTVSLAPDMKMSERQLKRLAASAGNWTLYEVMPIDRHEAFAGLDKEKLAAMLPAASVNEYAKDGQPASADDPPQNVVDGKYQRNLNDYDQLFHELDRQISEVADLSTAAAKDAASIQAALADAKEQVAFHQTEIADLRQELDRSQVEQKLITRKRESLETALAATRADLAATFQENRRLAQQWAAMQNEAARRYDDRLTGTQ